MGCVTATNQQEYRKSHPQDLALARSSILNDCDLARKKDEHSQAAILSNQIQTITTKNNQLSTELQLLKKQMDVTKKQSQDSLQQKQNQLKRLTQQKNKEIEQLKEALLKQKQKQTEKNKIEKEEKNNKKNQEKIENCGANSINKYKALCEECFYQLPRFIAFDKGSNQCLICRGYGLTIERFPYGANPSCDKTLCFAKGWDKVKCLKLCTLCQGKGSQQTRFYYNRRF